MSKINMDELEAKARKVAATGHGKAATAPLVLALIARIRELEALAEEFGDTFEGEGYANDAERIRAILQKGAVLLPPASKASPAD